MAKTVDERVVKAEFDNSQFDKKIEESMKTLEEFKKSLNLENSAKGFDELGKAASALDMTNLAKGVDALAFRFSALGETIHKHITGWIQDIENFSKKFTIDPVKMGLSEYEEKMDAIKLAMANTGEPLSEVKRTLEDLNKYADQTIYKFGDMTSNLGKFTAQGVGLEDAASAIKGISNLAAVTGANTEAASRAMYNFSQAMAIGKMELRDWRTMENTGMGNKEFRDNLIQAAKDLGYFDREWRDGQNHVISGTQLMNEAMTSFRETLKYGWMDNELMLETLKRYSGDAKDEAGNIYEIGLKASEAAKEITTLTKLIDVVQESFQSNWAYVWEKIIGDYNQSKKLWTELGNFLSERIEKFFDGIKTVLDDWAKLGGRFALIDTFKAAWSNLEAILIAVRDAFANVFPPLTGQTLMDLTMKLLTFVTHLRLTDDSLHNLQTIVEVVLKLVKFGGTLIGNIAKKLSPIAKVGNIIFGTLLDITAAVADWLINVAEAIVNSEKFSDVLDILKVAFFGLLEVLVDVGSGIATFVEKASELPIVQTIIDDITSAIENLGNNAAPILESVGGVFADLLTKIDAFGRGESIQNGIGFLDETLTNLRFTTTSAKGVFSSFFDLFKDNGTNVGDKMLNLADSFIVFNNNTAALTKSNGAVPALTTLDKSLDEMGETTETIWTKIGKVADTVLRNGLLGAMVAGLSAFMITASRATDSFRKVLNSTKGLIGAATTTLKAFTTQIKTQALVKIVAALVALSGALLLLTLPDPDKLKNAALSLGILGASLAVMAGALGFFSKNDFFGNFHRGSTMMLSMAASMLLLATALNMIDDSIMDWNVLKHKLVTLLGTLAILGGVFIAISHLMGGKVFGLAKALTILSMAKALGTIIESLQELSTINDLRNIERCMPIITRIMSSLALVAFSASLMSPLAGVGFLGVIGGVIALVEGFKLLIDLDRDELAKIDYTLEKLGTVLSHVEGIAWAIVAVAAIANLVKNVTHTITGITATITNNVQATFSLIGDAVGEAIKGLTFAAKVALIVGAFVAVAYTIKMLAELPVEVFEAGAIRAAGIAAVIIFITGIIGMLAKQLDITNALTGISTKILGLGVVLAGMAAVIKVASGLSATELTTAFIAVGGCLTLLGIFEAVLGKLAIMEPTIQIGVRTGAAMGVCLGVMALSLGVLSQLKWTELWPAAVSLGGVIAALAFALGNLAQVQTGPAVAAALGIMGTFGVLTGCFYLLQNISWKGVLPNLIEMVVALGVIEGMVWLLAGLEAPILPAVGVIGAIAVILGALAGVAYILQSIDVANLKAALLEMLKALGVLALVVGVLAFIDTTFPAVSLAIAAAILLLAGTAASMLGFAAAAWIFSEAASNMADVFIKLEGVKLVEIAKGVVAIAVASAALGATVITMLGAAISWGLWAHSIEDLDYSVEKLATAMDTLTRSIDSLMQVNPSELAKKIEAIAKAVRDLSMSDSDFRKLADGLASVLPKLSEMSTIIQDMDENMFNVKENVTAFADEVLKAADSLVKFVDEIIAFNDAVDGLWISVVATIGDEIEGAADQFMPEAGMYIIDKVVEGCRAAIPEKTGDIAQDLVDGLTQSIEDKMQAFYDSGLAAAKSWLDGMVEYLGAYCRAEATVNVANDLYDGLVGTMEDYSGGLTSSGKKSGEYYIEGITGSAVDGAPAAASQAANSFFKGAIACNKTFAQAAKSNAEAYNNVFDALIHGGFKAAGNYIDTYGFLGRGSRNVGGVANDTRTGPFQRMTNALQDQTNEMINTAVAPLTDQLTNLVDTELQVADASEYAQKYQDEMNAAVEESQKKVEEATQGLGDYENAAKGAGKGSKGAAKDMDEHAEAAEALTDAISVLTVEYGDFYEELGKTVNADKAAAALKKMGLSVEEFGKFVDGVGSKIDSALDNIWDAPKDRGWMDPKAIASNMRENLNQVSQWAHELGELSKRGLSQGVYKYLAEMGPEGYKYVHAFGEMTEDEIADINAMWEEKLQLSQAARNRVGAGFLNTGVMAMEGLVKGFENTDHLTQAIATVGQAGLDAIRAKWDIHSPSGEFESIGTYAISGLALGLSDPNGTVQAQVVVLANRVVEALRSTLLGGGSTLSASGGTLESIGRQVIEKIAAGMVSSVDTLNELMTTVVTNISQAINTKSEEFHQNGSYICEHLVEGFKDEMVNQEKYITDTINLMYEYIVQAWQSDENKKRITDDIVKFFVDTFCEELLSEKTSLKTFEDTLNDLANFIVETMTTEDGADSMKDKAKSIGIFWVAGIIEGIDEMTGDLEDKLTELGEMMEAVTMAATGEHSPSKITEKIGRYWDEGLAIGIVNGKTKVVSSIKNLADAMAKTTFNSLMGVNAEKLLIRGVQKSVNVFNDKAKSKALSTNTVQIKKIANDVATAFVPVSMMAGEAAEGVTNAVSKIKFNIYSSTKPISKQIKKAIKFVNEFDDSLARLDIPKKTIETLTGFKEELDFEKVGANVIYNLKKINKHFVEFGKAPKKITAYLDNVRNAMTKVNGVVKTMTKMFYDQTDQFNKHTVASNKAREGLVKIGQTILDNTDIGEEYRTLLEDVEAAEKALDEELESEEPDEEKIAELTEAYEEAADKVPEYLKAISWALDEYREKAKQAMMDSFDLFSAFEKAESIDPTSVLSNAQSHFSGWKEYGEQMAIAASKGFNSTLMLQLYDEGPASLSKLEGMNQMSEKYVALTNFYMEKMEKKAKKAAKKALAAVAETFTSDADAARQAMADALNKGDKIFVKVIGGNLEKWDQLLANFAPSSKEYESFLKDMAEATKAVETPLLNAGRAIFGLGENTSLSNEQLMYMDQTLFKLADVFDIAANSAENYGSYLNSIVEALKEYGQAVEDANKVSNIFEKANDAAALGMDQLLYNITSVRDAQINWDQLMDRLVSMGYSPDVIRQLESMGFDQGRQYAEGLAQGTAEQVGYINDTIAENINFSKDQNTKAQQRLLEAGSSIADGLREGLRAALEKNGVLVPLTDPSAQEEAKEAGEEVGEAYGESAAESGVYMFIQGVENGLSEATPQIVKYAKEGAEEVGTKAGKKAAKSTGAAIEENEDKITEPLQYALLNGVKKGIQAATDNVVPMFNTMFETLEDDILAPLSKYVIKNVGGAFTETLSGPVARFNQGMNTTRSLVESIPSTVNIYFNVDDSQLDLAVAKLNAAKDLATQVNLAAISTSSTYSGVNARSSSGTSYNTSSPANGSNSANTGTTITYNQYNTSPKALDAAEIYRNTQKQINLIKSYSK